MCMDFRLDQLPDDADALKAIIAALTVEAQAEKEKLTSEIADRDCSLAERDEEIAGLKHRVQSLQELNDRLDHHVRVLNRAQYGRRSEKLDADQLALLLEDTEQAIGEIHQAQEAFEPALAEKRARKANLGALPASLPREDQVIEPETHVCADCGCDLHVIGEDVSERLDVVPQRLRVIRTRRPRYGCRKCENAPVQAPAAPHIIRSGLPTERLIANVVVSKFGDYLPAYRQADIFARSGVNLDRSTLCNWIGRAAYEVQPVYERLVMDIKQSEPLFCDETPMPVLAPGNGQVKKGQLWALARDPRPYAGDEPPAVAYFYKPGRCKGSAAEVLEGVSGAVQVDGLSSYKAVANDPEKNSPIALSFCMAHLRRRFFDEIKDGYGLIAKEAVQKIAKIYEVEDPIRGKPPNHRRDVRQEKAKPLMEDFHKWLKKQSEILSQRSTLMEDINYAFNHWEGLMRYLDDGRLEIDSNFVERSIRPIAILRKNSLFAGNAEGAHSWARFASLLTTCKLNDVNPEDYLTDIFTRIANGWPQNRIDELLPFAYAAK